MAGTASSGAVISMYSAAGGIRSDAVGTSGRHAAPSMDVGRTAVASECCGCDGDTLRRQAFAGFNELLARSVTLYCHGESSSISELEASQIIRSVSYVLGVSNPLPQEVLLGLASDPHHFFERKLGRLERRLAEVMGLWQEVCATMPPLRNVSLRDTLASIGNLPARYDMRFAAHEVPCDIQYQLSKPLDDSLEGLDYLEAWLVQLKKEVEWIARFTPESCIAVLEKACPDYRGLHVNLYDLLKPREDQLDRK